MRIFVPLLAPFYPARVQAGVFMELFESLTEIHFGSTDVDLRFMPGAPGIDRNARRLLPAALNTQLGEDYYVGPIKVGVVDHSGQVFGKIIFDPVTGGKGTYTRSITGEAAYPYGRPQTAAAAN